MITSTNYKVLKIYHQNILSHEVCFITFCSYKEESKVLLKELKHKNTKMSIKRKKLCLVLIVNHFEWHFGSLLQSKSEYGLKLHFHIWNVFLLNE